MSELEALFRELTGYDIPDTAPPQVATNVLVDYLQDIEPGMNPADFLPDAAPDVASAAHDMGDLIGGAFDALSEEGSSMAQWRALVEREHVRIRQNPDGSISVVDTDGTTRRIPPGGNTGGTQGGRRRGTGDNRGTNRGPIRQGMIEIAADVSPQARDIFMADMAWTKSAFNRHGIGPLYNASRVTFKTINHPDSHGRVYLGMYYVDADRLEISAPYALRGRNTYKGTITHEYGHRFHFRCQNQIPPGERYNIDHHLNAFYQHARQNPGLFVTPYSRTSYIEFWAESFRFYVRSLDGMARTKPALGRWVKQIIRTFKSTGRF